MAGAVMMPARMRCVMMMVRMMARGLMRRVTMIPRERGLGECRQCDGENASSHDDCSTVTLVMRSLPCARLVQSESGLDRARRCG